MSLLEDFARSCVLLEQKRTPGPEGGCSVQWTEGEAFQFCMALDNSRETRRAEKQGAADTYSVLAPKECPIQYGDVFKDLSTGDTYRVISSPETAPPSSGLKLKHFTAERWELPG